MKENKKVSPSMGACGLLSSSMRKNLHLFSMRAMLVMLLCALGIGNAWAGANAYLSATTANPAEGLVYMSNSNSEPSIDKYHKFSPGGDLVGATGKDESPSNRCYVDCGDGNGPGQGYFWAKPARGFKFKTWKAGTYLTRDNDNTQDINTATQRASWNGDKDVIYTSAGGGQCVYQRPIAEFEALTKYTIRYIKPAGGVYQVHYEYLSTTEITPTISNYTTYYKDGASAIEYKFYTATEDYSLLPSLENNIDVYSYETDEITLIVPPSANNFIGWYENDVKIEGSENKKTLPYTAHANVTIEPKFKELAWGDATGDLTTNVTAQGTYDKRIIYVSLSKIGTWTAADFTVTPMNSANSFGSISIGTVSLDTENNRLVIPYTYTATNWGGIKANLTITPSFGATKEISIACSAEEIVAYEARIEMGGVIKETGDLADMLNIANGDTYDKPTLKLMNPVTITTPLSFTKSMTFDVYGKVLTANCSSAFSLDAEGIDVQIIDGSYTQIGEIHTTHASSGNVNVVTFTQAAKLTMQGGTLSVSNTGSGSAYGVNVCNGSIFYMTNGQLTVSADTGDAQGAHVATTSDYATFNGGSMNVSAPTNAYGIWSAGQSNITNANIIVAATTGAYAHGVYVSGGTSTITTTDFTVNANTTNAYGAYVNDGRLNFNGGKLMVEAVTSNVYGVHVAAGATAMMQQNAIVKAEATGVSGTQVFGINNLGTAILNNISVTATSPTTDATAVNSASSAVSTTIDGGTYRANTIGGGTAYGLHHQYGALTVDGGTFRAIGNGNNIYGGRAAANGSIANATLHGETQGEGNAAYGFEGGESGKNITLSNCTIEGISNTNKAYAIYTRSNVTATGCTLTANAKGSNLAYGLYAEEGTNSLTNCNATITAETISAYGAYHKSGTLSISGGTFVVGAKQTGVTAAQDSKLYGLYNEEGKTTTVADASFNVIAANPASSQKVYGAMINGTLSSTGATYNVTACQYVYGIQGMGSSNLILNNNIILVKATNINTTSGNSSYCYGIAAKKNFAIDGDKVDAIGYIKEVYAMFFDASTSNGIVSGGKFSAQANGSNGYGALNEAGTVGKVRLRGGVYKIAINLQKYADAGYQVFNLDETHSDYADGYNYAVAATNPSPYVCRIVNGAHYATLEEALQYTQDHDGTFTIVMTQNYILPAGDYVLPANATLVVPRKFGQTTITDNGDPAIVDKITAIGLNENFMCLTMASNANLNVAGKIGVSGEMYCSESGGVSNRSPYGRIHMESGSHIQLNSGAYLYAWGMITGSGSITVKSGAEVREMFQIKNMPSASSLQYYIKSDNNQTKYLPFNQYSIQNIEVPTTYYHNSRLMAEMRCYYPGMGGYWYGDPNIKLVGTSGALFEVTSNDESSWVCKSYDPTSKQQVWKVNSSAQLGSITIDMTIPIVNWDITVSSADYILPITNNMKIHVIGGDFAITNDTELMPGALVEIDKTASLTINSGKKVYVFDKDQWSATTSYADAAINVHGNINVSGALYTTSSIESGTNATHGANIYSNNADAGTVFFENAAPSATTSIDLITGIKDDVITTKTVTMDPALLRNGDNSTTATSGKAKDHAFAYINNVWTETYKDECFETIGEHVYVKPSDYVELKKQRDEKGDYEDLYIRDNHTYSSLDGARTLIHLPDAEGNCQWWDVVATPEDPTVFECTKTGYEGFYYYDEDNGWILKTVEVTFYAAETGDNVLETIVTDFNGIPDQAVIESNPTKNTTPEATYQFYGWKSSVTETVYPWTAALEVATDDMYYRPVFTETKRHYTVTFKNANNGADIPVEAEYNAHPVCTPTPSKAATAEYTYSFQYWLASDNTTQYVIDAELPAVTGATYYTAVWSSVVNRYTITWVDGETVLETDKHQLYGSATAFNGTLPTKPMDDNYVYAFSGWRSSLNGQTYANGSTPTVAGETTYEVQYSTTPRYKVTFANYDGTPLQQEFVTAGEQPIYKGLTPGRVRDLDGYFRFIGWKNSDGEPFEPNDVLPAVTGKETYTAQYDYVTELYEITLNNIDGAGGTWKGKFGVGSTPFYDPNNDDIADMPTKAGNAQYSYPFTGWTPALQPVSGEATYTAQFGEEINSYDITFANLDGNGASQTIKVEYGQTPVCPVTPSKDDGINSYPFVGWNTPIVPVTGEATYTAVFSESPITRQFDITFDSDNGTPATVVPVTYGETPSWTGNDPEKPATAQYTYTFVEWYPAFYPVSGEETYIAQYTQTLNSYTIRFVNYDGTELQSSTLAYGTMPTPPAYPSKPFDVINQKAYNFTGWSPTVTTVTGDATYTAQYEEVDFTASVTTTSDEITFYGDWSSALAAANSSADCILKLYSNVAAPALTKISNNMTIDLNGCTLSCSTSSLDNNRFIWVDRVALIVDDSKGGGKIYFEGTGNKNYNAVRVDGVGSLTVRGGTIQAHATNSNSSSAAYAVLLYNNSTTQGSTLNIYGGELIASHTQNARTASTVYFNGNNYVNVYEGKLKGKNSIFNNNNSANRVVLRGGYYSLDPGTTLTIPSGYEKQQITSAAMDPEYNNGYRYRVLKSNCTITWMNEDGTETIRTDNVAGGSSTNGPNPTKEETDDYVYTFDGWAKVPNGEKVYEIDATPLALDDATYYAHFTSTPKFAITFANLDGNGTSQTVRIALGEMPESPIYPEKVDGSNSYAWIGWEPELQPVSGEATYTALFSDTPSQRKHFIIFDPANGEEKQVKEWLYNATPEWEGANPEKASDEYYHYAFEGWSPVIEPVTAQRVYTAQYTSTTRYYTIRFVNWDDTELMPEQQLTFGEAPSVPSDASREVDVVNQKAYTFIGWSPDNGEHVYDSDEVPLVSADVIYKAQYNEVDLFATVTNAAGTKTTPYSNWSDALSAANSNSGSTLKLYQDPSTFANSFITISADMTIDLNGHTITGTCSSNSNTVLFNINNVALTIEDTHGDGMITYTGTYANNGNNNLLYRTMYVTGNSGSLTIKSGTINAAVAERRSTGYGRYYYANAVAVYMNSSNSSSPHLYVEGGELLATHTYNNENSKGYAVYFASGNYGYANVSGGKIQAKNAIFQQANAARTIVTGGYFGSTVSSYCSAPYYQFETTAAEKAEVGNAYNYVVKEAYTITFNNWDNSNLSTLQKQIVGTTPAYTGATPTKEPQSLYTFIGWKNTNDDFFAPDADLPAVAADETYTAQFEEVETFDVDGNASVTEDASVVTTTVHTDGTLDVADGVTLRTTNLILEASENASGQIIEGGTITATNVYFDLTLNTYARHWHSFGVPWMVDLNTNPLTEVETGRTLTIGRDYDIMYYNGEKRAQEGINADCWEYVQDNGNTLTPGQGYMIAFTSAVKTLRFVKAAGAPVIFSSAMSVAANNSGTETDKGINAIANPMAYHAILDVGVGVGQIHVSDTIGSDEYTEVNIENRKFIVGKAVYVKVPAAQPVVIAPAGSAGDFTPVAAPARRAKKQDEKKYMTLEDYYTVSLTPSNGSRAAKVYVLPMEEKDDAFITGQDLAKMSMSTKKAQIWVNRYESKLALNTTAPVNDIAQFPISVYAPEAGEYTISLQSQPDEEYTVYLTQDGRAFWNLSMDGCSLELAKGTNKSYGLRLVRSKAPQTATGIDEALVDAQGEIKKVIINDKVFIIRGDQVYSIDGQLVK